MVDATLVTDVLCTSIHLHEVQNNDYRQSPLVRVSTISMYSRLRESEKNAASSTSIRLVKDQESCSPLSWDWPTQRA